MYYLKLDISHQIIDCPQSQECWKITETILSYITGDKINLCKYKILFGFEYTESKHYLALNSLMAKFRTNFIQINRPCKVNYDKIIKYQIKEILNIEKSFLKYRLFVRKWKSLENRTLDL